MKFGLTEFTLICLIVVVVLLFLASTNERAKETCQQLYSNDTCEGTLK